MTRPYRGVWPVVPTIFTEAGDLDLEGQKRVVDCMVDQGSDGLCILANYSEQFLLSDDEREVLARDCIEHVAGRVPVIVTASHFATRIVAERCRKAAELGASMAMLMPPYRGAALKGTEEQTREQFARAADAAGLPIMVQDAPLSGVELSVPFLARIANEIDEVAYFKIETPQAAAKLRTLISAGGDAIEGPFDGEEAITLMADLDAGATGTMPSALAPDLLRPVVEAHREGRRDEAAAVVRSRSASHQLREPPVRPARVQGGHAGRRSDSVRPRACAARPAGSGGSRGPDGTRPAARSGGASLGPLSRGTLRHCADPRRSARDRLRGRCRRRRCLPRDKPAAHWRGCRKLVGRVPLAASDARIECGSARAEDRLGRRFGAYSGTYRAAWAGCGGWGSPVTSRTLAPSGGAPPKPSTQPSARLSAPSSAMRASPSPAGPPPNGSVPPPLVPATTRPVPASVVHFTGPVREQHPNLGGNQIRPQTTQLEATARPAARPSK